jgi:hypothetical protein
MKQTTFTIDGKERAFSIENAPTFKAGNDEVLSNEKFDITFHQPWYQEGYTEVDFLSNEQFDDLIDGISKSISAIIEKECGIDTTGFTLEKYHHFVKADEDHFKIVKKTRDLFSDDFSFSVKSIIPRLEEILKFNLTDFDEVEKEDMHIIVRINRPLSTDFNPPHKDIYEGVDKGYIPQFVNFWIPIAGVTDKSNLPIAPKSHFINEKDIVRTFEGAHIEGHTYRVRMIKSWNGSSDLVRSTVKYGQVLIFSSHLIHGLAVNDESDLTRVALEFRLFKKDN